MGFCQIVIKTLTIKFSSEVQQTHSDQKVFTKDIKKVYKNYSSIPFQMNVLR